MSLFHPRLRFGLAAVAFALVLASCGTDDPAAEVGDFSVDRSVFGESVTKAEAAPLLSDWVNIQRFYAELADRGYTPDPAILQTIREDFEDASLNDPTAPSADSFEGQNIIRGGALGLVVLDFFAAEAVDLPGQGELCSSHILVETEAEALDVIDRLGAGEDFGSIALELSLDAGSGDGSLGCIDSGGLVPEFVDGVRETEIPGLSVPVQSQFGWHVIDVISFDPQPIVDENAQIDALIRTPAFEEFQLAVNEQDVAVDPDFGTWDAATSQVVP